jgi:hypothetical protein
VPPHCTPASTLPACAVDVSITVTPPSGTVYVGQEVLFAVTVANAGPGPASGLGIALRATPGKVRMRTPASRSSCLATCHFSIKSLGAGKQANVEVRLRPVAAGKTTLEAWLTIPPPNDTGAANNSGSAAVTAVVGRCTSGMPATDNADRIFGTVGGEVVNGLAGYDLISGGDGEDCLSGGRGDDRILGGPGADLLKGGPGADVISGGPGHDKISGGPGADTISAADGERDSVNCGPGRDTVKADKADRLRGCERIRVVH